MTRTAGRLLRAGTRSSRLARWQTARVAGLLRERTGLLCEEIPVSTEGDRRLDVPLPEIGGKGVFTEALEDALRSGEIDFAVHSLKDLPIEDPPGIVLAAVLDRIDARDVLVAREPRLLSTLPRGARVGSSSVRRMAQIRAARRDVDLAPLRGNVDTRVRKALEGAYDAIVLAAAGLLRLGLGAAVREYLPFEVMLPAPGQAALAVQCRSEDRATREALDLLDDPLARAATAAERGFLEALGGGCSAPVAAHARLAESGEELELTGLVLSPDGTRRVRVQGRAPLAQSRALAASLAKEALAQGARECLS